MRPADGGADGAADFTADAATGAALLSAAFADAGVSTIGFGAALVVTEARAGLRKGCIASAGIGSRIGAISFAGGISAGAGAAAAFAEGATGAGEGSAAGAAVSCGSIWR